MSIGYETQVPPINILTFYNAIANNGVSIRPKFVKAAVRDGEVIKEYPTEIINPKICSDKTLAQIREILRKVVGEGLAKPAGSKQFHVSGKTGTAQVSQGVAGYKTGRTNYLVSFCGYFPSEEPKYSMIVSIQKPGLPASGGLMAGSVFSKIAERVYAKDLRLPLTSAIDTNTVVIPNVKAGEMRETQRVLEELNIKIQGKITDSGKEVWGSTHPAPQAVVLESRGIMQNFVPSVVGMGAKDAVYLLESKGLKVNLVGVGKVKSQSIANGSVCKKRADDYAYVALRIKLSRTDMLLNELLKAIQPVQVTGDSRIEITGVNIDSRLVEAGQLFMAMRGTQTDGHAYIPAAIQKGATAILCEDIPEEPVAGITYIQVKDSEDAVGKIATTFYGNPTSQFELVGVTGTNGKTTIATLLYNTFRYFGYKVGLISTVCNYIDDQPIPTEHTTPDPITLNRLLGQMADEGCKYVFMEVSSHSIAQKRISGLKFAGGIFTNLTRDHLDYHKTVENYLKAKKKFFDDMPKNAFSLTNLDDKNGLVMMTQNTRSKVYTYSLRSLSDFKGRVIESHFEGMLLDFNNHELAVQFIGKFNASNLLAVFGAAVLLGKKEEDVLLALSTLHPVAGRFDAIRSPKGVTAIVDYAHTPDALVNVLNAIHGVLEGKGKVITVVGAGGNRDKGKRPIMAKEAAKASDRVIITSDNPRFEEPQEIINDMLAGLDAEDMKKTLSIADRKEAIRTACMLAEKGDVILVAGKGHENYQEIKGVKHHFDDKEVLKEIFN